jgi:hypothetical protein
MVQSLLAVMSYNILYELFPEQEILNLLEVILGSPDQAKKIYVDLHYSSSVPHYTRINLGLLDLAQEWLQADSIPSLEAFIRDMAFAFDFYIQANELEDPASLRRKVIELAENYQGSVDLLKKEYAKILEGRERQKKGHFLAWKQVIAALRGGQWPTDQQLQVLAALGLRQTLTTEEEERHFLQMRVQRNCRWALEALDLPMLTTSLDTLFFASGAPERKPA